ncbi:hypothetical protein GIB67_018500 [Kingdonia uniflora]|uniref:Uncharacterized protein n=1 Tax=Kingdonia uniflora TaxID=39325 RepID=A0A7J7LW78_9MAGN|nr:hypothetical protein GIB67_018500 [Kingdonia uniflora]
MSNHTPSHVHAVKNLYSNLKVFIIKECALDGIDIDLEAFESDPGTFSECIGQLITRLKSSKVISYAMVAPFGLSTVQQNYQALWRNYGKIINHVNFQFCAYDKKTTVSQFLEYFDFEVSNYECDKVFVSLKSDSNCGCLSNEGSLRHVKCWKGRGGLLSIDTH